MSNPLDIPEITAKVFKYLDTKDLVNACYVNKIWRLEAGRIIYQNRNEIIYNLLRPFLNAFRLSYGMIVEETMAMRFNLAMRKFTTFRKTFNLDARIELLAIRDILRREHKKFRNRHKKLIKKVNKCNYAMERLAMDSEEYRQMDDLCWKRTVRAGRAEENRFYTYRKLVDFEYFLSILEDIILDKNEINAINSKVENLREEEFERF